MCQQPALAVLKVFQKGCVELLRRVLVYKIIMDNKLAVIFIVFCKRNGQPDSCLREKIVTAFPVLLSLLLLLLLFCFFLPDNSHNYVTGDAQHCLKDQHKTKTLERHHTHKST